MAKFVWQDGTLVSKAKVKIGGTIYEVDPEEYSGSTPLSASNLNAMVDQTYQDLKDYADGTVLYNNPNGSSSNITLNDTSANYQYIEVFGYSDTDKYTSVKIYQPNGKKFIVRVNYTSGALLVDLLSTYSISAKTISPILDSCGYVAVTTQSGSNFNKDKTNYFKITRVVGHK